MKPGLFYNTGVHYTYEISAARQTFGADRLKM